MSYVSGLFLIFLTTTVACATPMKTGTEQTGAKQTASGIALDAPWKSQIYAYAKANIAHPAWGLAHSERNYHLSTKLAARESVSLDADVLFAAAFLHDLGAIEGFAKPGVDHAARSAELSEPLLKQWGFPMEKWPAVKDMILGHMFDAAPSPQKATLIFRDADTLDFLGSLGAARILSATMDHGPFQSLTLSTPFAALHKFHDFLPTTLTFPASRELGKSRAHELETFLTSAEAAALGGTAL